MIYHSRTMSGQRFKSIWRTREHLWWLRGLVTKRYWTMSPTKRQWGRRMKVYLNSIEISQWRFQEELWPGTQVYLSKAKLGIYIKYLGLYICFWDRGYVSHSGVSVGESTWSWEKWARKKTGVRYKYTVMREVSQTSVGYKYTVVREMSQEKDKHGRKVKEGANHNTQANVELFTITCKGLSPQNLILNSIDLL